MASQQDFTIEEKLNEESYISKDGFIDKTMEYKQSVANEHNPFSHSANDTAQLFADTVNAELRNGDADKIRIENNHEMSLQKVEIEADIQNTLKTDE